jgi:hypothetical protein
MMPQKEDESSQEIGRETSSKLAVLVWNAMPGTNSFAKTWIPHGEAVKKLIWL